MTVHWEGTHQSGHQKSPNKKDNMEQNDSFPRGPRADSEGVVEREQLR